MAAQKLTIIRVEKPWGRMSLWQGFDDPAADQQPIGEIWFDAPGGDDPDLMVKYLFTGERLSIQVHPSDADAQRAGYARGKDEAWVILDAAPGATIAIGTVRPVSRAELRAAALDGSIEALMDWKPVRAGDVIYSPAGTVHAIGADITMVEIQQNVDLTYRLYDYGRPRELHLDAGIDVADTIPFVMPDVSVAVSSDRTVLVQGRKFVIERWQGPQTRHWTMGDRNGWLVPLSGSGQADGTAWNAGECWLIHGDVEIVLDAQTDVLFAYTGAQPL
jgi:mannose-6-phosphate isomerase